MRGAVDLGALATARQNAADAQERAAQRAADPQAATVELSYDVTEATFQSEVIDKSFQVPVVVDLWATWCEPCKQLSPLLEKLVEEDAGTWLLAKVDVDAQQAIGAAFQVQSIPSIVAIVKGQPVPLFQGALPEAQVRQFLTELLKVAATAGLTGLGNETAPPVTGQADAVAEPSESDARFDAAFDAFEAGDWDGAEAAYRAVLATDPAEPDALAGLIRVELMRRTDGVDPQAALATSDATPEDVTAASLAADIDLLNGDARAAFARLIQTVRLTSGDERAKAREHLVGLFDLVGASDPDVVSARTALANALF